MVKGRTSMHNGFTRRGPDWRTCIVVLAVALIGAASASTIWHGEHGADQDCAICQLRHHSVADLSTAPDLDPIGSPEPFAQTPVLRWVASDHGSQIPARAPPA